QGNNLLGKNKTAEAEAKFEQAIAEYNACLRINPEDPQAPNNLGHVLAQREKVADAIAEYRKAIQIKNENPEAHFNLGFALFKQGKAAEAEAEYLIALKQRPNYSDAVNQLQTLRAAAKLPP
ncbi:MAG: tetratricopeptide repeat protein, partial [Limisphaerales bacterium]